MASSAGHRHPKCHVLNFFYDKVGGCALTVTLNNVRFHIIADPDRLKGESGPAAKLQRDYEYLLEAVKRQEQGENLTSAPTKETSSHDTSQSQDSGNETGPESSGGEEDSGVDVSEKHASEMKPAQELQTGEEAEDVLHQWMLSPFGQIFQDNAPPSDQKSCPSVADWYNDPTMFFNLVIENSELSAEEEESSEELLRRMKDMTPKISMPKYIRKMDIPWYSSKDVKVLDASDEPGPYHPSRVEVEGKTYFLKMVDMNQPQPTKREIDTMKKIEKLGLHKQMRVPLVEGIVGFEESKTDACGFLQTEIEDPTPLTKMLDSEIPQSKRDRWAKEAERMKNILHENGLVWGDAKADNYMVDKHDNLWIIDFGGSYTDGWVDPELMETEEGDDMGVERVVNALHDPDANTWDPTEDEQKERKEDLKKEKDSAPQQSDKSKKRKPSHDPEEKKDSSPKRRRQSTADEAEQEGDSVDKSPEEDQADDEDTKATNGHSAEKYCYCNWPSSGQMVGCDNDGCKREWFHLSCLGLKEAPQTETWYCNECRESGKID